MVAVSQSHMPGSAWCPEHHDATSVTASHRQCRPFLAIRYCSESCISDASIATGSYSLQLLHSSNSTLEEYCWITGRTTPKHTAALNPSLGSLVTWQEPAGLASQTTGHTLAVDIVLLQCCTPLLIIRCAAYRCYIKISGLATREFSR